MRPSTFSAPGLDSKTDATIRKILRRWALSATESTKKTEGKKRQRG